MTLDEAIEHARAVTKHCDNNDCAREHAQLAEWLEELRDRREEDSRTDYWDDVAEGDDV